MDTHFKQYGKKPTFIEVSYTVETPIYLGAMEEPLRNTESSLRTEINGLLRFWVRALAPHLKIVNPEMSRDEAIKSIHAYESRLLGAPSKQMIDQQNTTRHNGNGSLHIASVTLKDNTIENEWANINRLSVIVGQRLYKKPENKKPENGCVINSGSVINLILHLYDINQKDNVAKILTTIGQYGSIGAQKRHGLGSLSLEKIEINKIEINKESVRNTIELLEECQSSEQEHDYPFATFPLSKHPIIVHKLKGNNAASALKEAEEIEVTKDTQHTKHTKHTQKNSIRKEINPKTLLKGQSDENKAYLVSTLGLARVYGSNVPEHNSIKIKLDSALFNRRTSPLLRHIAKSDNSYQVTYVLLNGDFLYYKGHDANHPQNDSERDAIVIEKIAYRKSNSENSSNKELHRHKYDPKVYRAQKEELINILKKIYNGRKI